MMSNTPPWENIKFSERGIVETLRKFFNTLENVYSFFATYANIDGFVYSEERIPVNRRLELDRWIMSRLNSTIRLVDESLDDYNPTRAARTIERFVDDLSNWYIRRSRRRFWKEGDKRDDKLAAYQTVYECLIAIARLMSPIAPFFGEWLYRSLNEVTGKEEAQSVHLALFPQVEEEAIDLDLEHRMGLARTISSTVLALRNESGINVRQPLPRILVVTDIGVEKESIESVRDIVLDEVNVKAIEYVSGSSDVVKRTIRPNFKRLGKRLGKLMKPVNEALRGLGEAEVDRFVSAGRYSLQVDGETVELDLEDVEVLSEGIAGWLVGQEDGVTTALDTTLTPELIAEGMARETINRVQNMRKSAGFEVTDRIGILFNGTDRIRSAVLEHAQWIRNETLALELDESEQPTGSLVETFEIGDDRLTIGVRRM